MQDTENKEWNYVSVIKTEMVKEKDVLYSGVFTNPKEAAAFAEGFFRKSTREMLVVVSLDAQKRPVAAEVVSVGLLSSCMVGIPEVFRHAILACADALLCFHNHPSSSLTPSTEDIRVTKRLKEAGELLGIRLLDHIIIGGDGSYVSLNEKGYL